MGARERKRLQRLNDDLQVNSTYIWEERLSKGAVYLVTVDNPDWVEEMEVMESEQQALEAQVLGAATVPAPQATPTSTPVSKEPPGATQGEAQFQDLLKQLQEAKEKNPEKVEQLKAALGL